jgi:hypothetical protein
MKRMMFPMVGLAAIAASVSLPSTASAFDGPPPCNLKVCEEVWYGNGCVAQLNGPRTMCTETWPSCAWDTCFET